MKTVTVLPRDDGQDFQNSWMVHVNGKMKSPHVTKQAAINAARGYASDGDTLEIRRTDGSIQDRRTVRKGGSEDTADATKTGMPGLAVDIPMGDPVDFAFPDSDGDYGEGTLDVNDLL